MLGDSASRPRFIATIPRRGYSFIAAVGVEDAAEEADDEKPDEPALAPAEVAAPPPIAPVVSPGPEARAHPGRLAWIAAIAFLVVASLFAYLQLRRSSKPSASPEVVPLTSYRGLQRSPTLSPDGSKVAFIWVGESGDNLDIYVQRMDGSGRVRLTSDPAAEEYPAWSPDGRTIAFIRQGEIFTIPSEGGPERRITTARGRGLTWSPDSRLLAFSDQVPGGGRAIFSVSSETGERRELAAVTQAGDDYMWPTFSPDGAEVAYVRRATTMTDVWRVPASGGKPIRMLITYQPGSGLVWTPDGRYLLYATGRHAPGLLAIPSRARDAAHPNLVEIAGTNVFEPTIIARNRGREQTLAYGHENTNWDIWAAPFDAGGIGRASPVADSIRADQAPSISPDGRRIAFSSARSGYEEIWVAMADGSQPQQLTKFNSAVANSPRWSPDGKLIVFDATIHHNSDIYTVSPEGGAPVRITSDPSAEVQGNWSHDGKWIYFMSDRSGSKQVWKLPAAGGAAVQVTRNGGFQAFESEDGEYVYYAKEQYGQGVWRVPVNGGTETLVSNQAWHNLWCLVGADLYYFDVSSAMPDVFSMERSLALRRLDLKTNAATTVGTIKVSFPLGVPALDVSRDGKYITWVGWREHSSELMVIRNFRFAERP